MKVSIDSRTIQPGDYFIPVQGPNFDGRDYIQDALDKGGHLLDVDLYSYAKKYRKKLSCTVIGITGSAGKTTVKDMCASVLSQRYNVVKTQGNQNNEIGVPLTLLSADSDTDILLVEMGLRKKGDLKYLSQLVQPDCIIFTGVGKTHLEFFDSQRQLATAKSEIFRKALSWQTKSRFAFINAGSDYADLVQKKAQKAHYSVVSYSGENKLGENINCCYALGRFFEIPNDSIQEGIRQFQPSAHRMQSSQVSGVTIVDDSYNANPDGVLYALQSLRQYQGRKILVLADMLELGDASEKEHQKVVEHLVNEEIDIAFLLGTHTQHMHSDSVSLYHFPSRDALNEQLKYECKSGDIILVKGSRSFEMEHTVEYLKNALS